MDLYSLSIREIIYVWILLEDAAWWGSKLGYGRKEKKNIELINSTDDKRGNQHKEKLIRTYDSTVSKTAFTDLDKKRWIAEWKDKKGVNRKKDQMKTRLSKRYNIWNKKRV